MELTILKGAKGMASCDPNSLHVLTYCKIAGIDNLKVTEVTHWKNFVNCSYPSLKVYGDSGNEEVIYGSNDIIKYFRSREMGIDSNLDPLKSAEAQALEVFVKSNLLPLVDFILWIEDSWKSLLPMVISGNIVSTTFFSTCILPVMRRRHHDRLSRIFLRKLMCPNDFKMALYHNGKDCIKSLSAKLDSKSYFFGDQPCYIDALVLSLLVMLKQIPSTDKTFSNYISQFPNLESFCKRFSSSLFGVNLNAAGNQGNNQALTLSTTHMSDFPHAIRNSIAAAIVAIGAISMYMLSTGMLKLEFLEEPKERPKNKLIANKS